MSNAVEREVKHEAAQDSKWSDPESCGKMAKVIELREENRFDWRRLKTPNDKSGGRQSWLVAQVEISQECCVCSQNEKDWAQLAR